MKINQAIFFFFAASAMLLILYLFLDYLKDIFSILILISCIGCASIILEDFMLQCLTSSPDHFLKQKFTVPCCGEMNVASAIGTLVGIVVSVSWYITHNWVLNNLLALLLALTFLKTLRLRTLIPGVLLLSLLFFYDIFWVFITPYFTKGGQSVMVAVATGLDIPIKLVMPHISINYPTSACSLLGLGDILIPGIFITFMARFGDEVVKSSSYFNGAIIAYSIALITCGSVLWIFQAAQPALLYIVPALFIAVSLIGFARGDFQRLKEGIPKRNRSLKNHSDDEIGENKYN